MCWYPLRLNHLNDILILTEWNADSVLAGYVPPYAAHWVAQKDATLAQQLVEAR